MLGTPCSTIAKKRKKRKRLRAATAAALNLPAASCEMELCDWAALNYTFPLITICLSGLFIYFLLSFHGAEEEATKFSNQGRM